MNTKITKACYFVTQKTETDPGAIEERLGKPFGGGAIQTSKVAGQFRRTGFTRWQAHLVKVLTEVLRT